MSNQWHEGQKVGHDTIEMLTWPVLTGSVAVWPVWPWFGALWQHAPTPTAIYMAISALFMLFQMSDKLGWLDRFKKRPKPPKDLR